MKFQNRLFSPRAMAQLLFAICLTLTTVSFNLSHATNTPETDFGLAVENEQISKVKNFLKDGLSPNSKNQRGEPMIVVAGRGESIEIINLLLKAGADVNARSSVGDTAMMLAAFNGQLKVMKRLREAGATINSKGWTPLLYAVSNAKTAAAEWLIQQGASMDTQAPNGVSALMLAVRGRDQKTVEMLLDYGADPSMKNDKGETALDWAREREFTELVKVLEKVK